MGKSAISMAIFNSTGVKKSTGAAMFRPCDRHRLGPDNHLIRSTWEAEEGGRTETELVASKSSWFAGKKTWKINTWRLQACFFESSQELQIEFTYMIYEVFYGQRLRFWHGQAHRSRSFGLTAPTNLAIVSPLKEMPFCIPFDNQTWLAGKSLFEMEVLIWKSSN